MGGMIVQLLAIEHPGRVRSLTSIMSTTGDPGVGEASDAAIALLMAPPAGTREAVIEGAVLSNRVMGSPSYPMAAGRVRARAARAFDRAYDPAGFARQLQACLTTPDRTRRCGVSICRRSSSTAPPTRSSASAADGPRRRRSRARSCSSSTGSATSCRRPCGPSWWTASPSWSYASNGRGPAEGQGVQAGPGYFAFEICSGLRAAANRPEHPEIQRSQNGRASTRSASTRRKPSNPHVLTPSRSTSLTMRAARSRSERASRAYSRWVRSSRFRAVGAQEAHGVRPAQGGEHIVLARRQHRVTPVEQRRDATVAVDQDVVREQVVVAHDVGHVDRACPFDHRFEPVDAGHDLAATVADPRVVVPVAQHLDAPLVHIGAGQDEVGDLVHGAHRLRDRVGVVPRCLAAVDEREQRVAPAMVRGGVRAVERSLRRRNGDAPSRQLSGQRQCGVAVGLLTPEFHEPAPVGERIRFEPARMRPQLAHLDTEGVADLSRRRRAYFAPHRTQDTTGIRRSLPLAAQSGPCEPCSPKPRRPGSMSFDDLVDRMLTDPWVLDVILTGFQSGDC